MEDTTYNVPDRNEPEYQNTAIQMYETLHNVNNGNTDKKGMVTNMILL